MDTDANPFSRRAAYFSMKKELEKVRPQADNVGKSKTVMPSPTFQNSCAPSPAVRTHPAEREE